MKDFGIAVAKDTKAESEGGGKKMGGIDRRFWKLMLILAVMEGGYGGLALGTPSTNFYTPCTSYIQPYRVLHLTYDSYFNREVAFATDVGLTIGFSPWEKFQGEVGFDLFYPSNEPLFFNARVGVLEDKLLPNFPGVNLGIWAMGTKKDETDFNIVELNIGKGFPRLGSIAFGLYKGLNPGLLEDEEGVDQSFGWLISYYRTLEPLTDRVGFSCDYMSGENLFSGGGAGFSFWLTRSINLILGWVWFENHYLNPEEGLFTIQLDADLDWARFLEGEQGREVEF